MKALQKISFFFLFSLVTCGMTHLSAQQQKLFLEGFNDANLNPGSGMLQMGETDGPNMIMDRNEIQTRNDGSASSLFLNIEGGDVKTGSTATPSNFWTTGFLRSGTDSENVRFKFHYETGTKSGSNATINLNLPAGVTSQDVIMLQLRTVGGLGNMVPVDVGTYTSGAITSGQIINDGTVYHVGIIYID